MNVDNIRNLSNRWLILRTTMAVLVSAVLAMALPASPANAQVPYSVSMLRSSAEFPLPGLSPAAAPSQPTGGIVLGQHLWSCDSALGLVRLDPIDAANAEPLNSGFLYTPC